MSAKNQRSITPESGGILHGLSMRLKLILRLIGDQRISPFLKILPIGSLAYLVIPDLIIGPFDDATIVWLGTYLFVELCPPEIVKEHMEKLRQISSPQWQDLEGDNDTVDAEYRDMGPVDRE